MDTPTIIEEYKGFTIEKETEPWAIKFGWNFRFYRDENLRGGKTVLECKDQIDELTIDEE
jgi:hypothetical protein